MITEEEFDKVQDLLVRSRTMPRNRRGFAFTGLIRCGSCGSAVTAEEKHQLVCPGCKLKFAHRSRDVCPGCKTRIADMENPRKLSHSYYHCTKSQNPACPERGIKREDLEKQFMTELEKVQLPFSDHRDHQHRQGLLRYSRHQETAERGASRRSSATRRATGGWTNFRQRTWPQSKRRSAAPEANMGKTF